MEQEVIKPGIYRDLDNERYHKSAGVSKSGLDLLAVKNPAAYRRRYTEAVEEERTKAMIVGSATHCMVFEPEIFDRDYAVEPVINKRTKQGKADAEQFAEDNKDKQILSNDDYLQVSAIATAVITHPVVAQILADGQAECSYFAEDPETGLTVKARPDWESIDTLYDLKTCQDASRDEFSKVIYNRRYYVQAGMYRHIVNLAHLAEHGKERIKNFCFIAVEKKEPYQVAIYVCDDEILFHGLEEYKRNMRLYRECMESGRWPGYNDDKIARISLPVWAENVLNRRF